MWIFQIFLLIRQVPRQRRQNTCGTRPAIDALAVGTCLGITSRAPTAIDNDKLRTGLKQDGSMDDFAQGDES